MAKQGSSTKQLKQTLGFWDLMSTAIGQIIGAGIMTLLGSAIALTGHSVPISFLIAAILVVGYSIPKILICGAVRARGGEYTMVAMLGGTRMAGIYTVVNTLSNLSLAMYSLSFASYFISLFGFGNEKVIALIVTTIFFLINIVGVDIMAKFQNLIVTMLCIALGLFAVVGLKYVQPDYLTNGFLTDGIGGLFQAGGLLTFAVGGSTVVANLSAEAKNPTRDIPVVMLVSTLIVAVIYGLIGIVAAGVLPVEQVAGENLSLVAQYVLSRPLYVFFMTCGAMFALISTLNAQFAWATKPILQGCDDGWLPQQLAYLHPKFKTPVVLLGILYVIAVVCIISGLSVSILGNLSLIMTTLAVAIICAFTWKLPIICPKGWANSKFKVSGPVMTAIVIFSTACAVFNIWLNVTQLSKGLIIGNVVLLIIGFFTCGREFGVKTVYTSIMLPVFLGLFEKIFPDFGSMTNSQELDVLCYTLVVSVGLSILFNRNASSGGLDIVAKIMNKYLHMELGKAMSLSGMCVALSAALVYDKKTVVLSILGTYFNGMVLDHFIFDHNIKRRVCVITQKEEELRKFIIEDLHSGATIYEATGAYNMKKRNEIITIVDKTEYQKLMAYINHEDPKAFVTVYNVSDMRYQPKL